MVLFSVLISSDSESSVGFVRLCQSSQAETVSTCCFSRRSFTYNSFVLTVVSLLVPALRLFRIARVFRVLRSLRAARSPAFGEGGGYFTASLATYFTGRDAEDEQAEVAGAKQVEALHRDVAALRKEIQHLLGQRAQDEQEKR